MKLSARFVAVSLLLLSTFATADTLTGTVKNGTSGKSAAGDDVVLIKLAQGMEEVGRTKTDAKGNFSFNFSGGGDPHLVRVIHQDVTYHRMAPPGTPSVEVQVYDVAKKVEGLSVTADVMRFQAQDNQLQGLRLFAVQNDSRPPRTQMNDQNFEFYLPEGAQIDTALAQTAGGQPINSAPVPQKDKNRYAFIFPLRPGETQFQVVFHTPYSGQASIDPRALYGTQHFVVMVPKSMQFTAAPGATFKTMQDPRQTDALVEVASNTQAGQPLAFKISGTGLLSGGEDQEGGEPPRPGAAAGGRDSRPGGGLGPPIDAPDPLEKYRWYLLGGFALVLAGGAIYIVRRPKTVAIPDFADPIPEASLPSVSAARPISASRSALLMEALKEELFQLEVEHKQGYLSPEEYQKARAALDQTLERAIKRTAQPK